MAPQLGQMHRVVVVFELTNVHHKSSSASGESLQTSSVTHRTTALLCIIYMYMMFKFRLVALPCIPGFELKPTELSW